VTGEFREKRKTSPEANLDSWARLVECLGYYKNQGGFRSGKTGTQIGGGGTGKEEILSRFGKRSVVGKRPLGKKKKSKEKVGGMELAPYKTAPGRRVGGIWGRVRMHFTCGCGGGQD